MCDDCYCGKNTNLIVGHKCSCNQDAIYEIMNAVTDQNHPTTTASIFSIMAVMMVVTIPFMMVVMTKKGNLLEQEKSE